MKAIAHDGYGPPEDLRLREVDKPRIDATGVLIRVRAASVNPLDWHLMRGEPSFMRMMGGKNPVERIPGSDAAGHVEEVGGAVTHFQPGDEVFGTCRGARRVCGGPGKESGAQARARHMGAGGSDSRGRVHGTAGASRSRTVTSRATCARQRRGRRRRHICGSDCQGAWRRGDRRLQHAQPRSGRSIGADRVIDYTAEDFTRGDARYDLILQLAGSQKTAELRRALTPRGSLIVVGAGTGREPGATGMLEVIRLMVTGRLMAPFVRRRTLMFVASIRGFDLAYLAHLVETQTITPVIERTFPLAEAPDAIRHLETGHARGKLIVQVACAAPVPLHQPAKPVGPTASVCLDRQRSLLAPSTRDLLCHSSMAKSSAKNDVFQTGMNGRRRSVHCPAYRRRASDSRNQLAINSRPVLSPSDYFGGTWPDFFPGDTPPPDAVPAEGPVFRIVETIPSTALDFRSRYELSPGHYGDKMWMACGVSFHTDLEDSRRVRDRFPALRTRRIAVGTLEKPFGVMKPTPAATAVSHLTVWFRVGTELPAAFSKDAEV